MVSDENRLSPMPDDFEVVQWMDPDWRDHFRDAASAAEFYRTYSRTEWDAAVKELR